MRRSVDVSIVTGFLDKATRRGVRFAPELRSQRMQLLFAVINHEELVDDILAGFIELGITGATVVESKGMGRVLSREVPIFAGLRTLAAASRPANRTIFCLADDEKIESAIGLIQEICGSLDAPGAGILFTVPVGRVIGLAPELEE
jgi:nitrogen regulatory protein P-II 1